MPVAALIPLAISLASGVASSVNSIRTANKQKREANRLSERGPDGLSPGLAELVARSRASASATTAPGYQEEVAMMDQGVSEARGALERISKSASDVLSGTAGVQAKKFMQMNRIRQRNAQYLEQQESQLDQVLATKAQAEQRNKERHEAQVTALRNGEIQNRASGVAGIAQTVAGAAAGYASGAFGSAGGGGDSVNTGQGIASAVGGAANAVARTAQQPTAQSLLDQATLASMRGDTYDQGDFPHYGQDPYASALNEGRIQDLPKGVTGDRTGTYPNTWKSRGKKY